MANLKIVAGLGNPGTRYQFTRHNIGFMLVDRLIGSLGVGEDPTEFRQISGSGAWKEKDGALLNEVHLGDIKIVLMKPQTYMNESGRAVAALSGFFKVPLSDLIVVCDDIDLPLGSLRVRFSGGDGGQKGVRSVAECLGGRDFYRIRLGVGRPASPSKEGGAPEVSDWVLSPFQREEMDAVDQVLDRGVGALKTLILEGLEACQRSYN